MPFNLIRSTIGISVLVLTGLLFACSDSEDDDKKSILEDQRNQFSDQNLFNCVLEHAALNGWFHPAQVNELNCTNMGITDLTGISIFTELTALNMSANDISNLSPLVSIQNLVNLNIEENANISDFSPLSSMISLQNLNMRRTEISDLSVLENSTGLQELNLNENGLDDTSGLATLSSLTSLQVLSLELNSISDVTFLSTQLPNLTYLSLAENNISDITALANQTSLVTLNLNNNEIAVGLNQLTVLSNASLIDLSNNRVPQNTVPQTYIYTIPCSDLVGLISALDSPPINLDSDTGNTDSPVDSENCTST